MTERVTWEESIAIPQPDDNEFEVPFCRIPSMTPVTVPDTVVLHFRNGRRADDRRWSHYKVIGQDEMGDRIGAVSRRVAALRETHDLLIVGDGSSLDDSRQLAVFMASTALTQD